MFRRQSLVNSKINIILNKISCMSLGIYFVHRPIQMYICKYIHFNDSLTFFSVITLWTITFLTSIIILIALERVEVLRKWIFIIK